MEEKRKTQPERELFCPLLRTLCIHDRCAMFDGQLKQRCFLSLAAEALDLLGEMSFDKLRQKKPII